MDAQGIEPRGSGRPALKNHVEGANFAALLASAEAGDVTAMLPDAGESLAKRDSLRQSMRLDWACCSRGGR